jgi:aminomethyltransferase
MSHQTPLLAEHRKSGATFTDFAGWQMPLKYGSELDEHHAVRKAAGLFDLSHMGEIRVTGRQAAEALDYALVGHLSRVDDGRAKYTLLCNASGGVLDDLVVYRLARDDFMIVANASNVERVTAELVRRAAVFDVDIVDHSASTALIAVQGPASAAALSDLLHDQSVLSSLRYYASTPARVAGIEVLLARTGYTGEDGFELYVDNDAAPQLWRQLLEVIQSAGGSPAGLAARDTLRLEAGMALYGHELTSDTNPFEAGLGRVIGFDKSFVGSQALQELSHREPTRRLIGLVGTGRRAARAGYAVLHEGEPVGQVTSGALSPTLARPVALGYVQPDLAEPGTELAVDVRGNPLSFTVTTPPFYKRPRP